MKLTRFDRPTVLMLQEKIQSVLKKEIEQYGITLEANGSSFGDLVFKPKFTFKIAQNAEGLSADEAMFKMWQKVYGVAYGQTMQHQGMIYKAVKLNPKAKRFPIVAERLTDGKRFKFTHLAFNKGV